MEGFSDDILQRASVYAQRRGMLLDVPLGKGKDGTVFRLDVESATSVDATSKFAADLTAPPSSTPSAIKVFERAETYTPSWSSTSGSPRAK